MGREQPFVNGHCRLKAFCAELLWHLRMPSLAIHVLLQAALGLVFVRLVQVPVRAPRNQHNTRLQS